MRKKRETERDQKHIIEYSDNDDRDRKMEVKNKMKGWGKKNVCSNTFFILKPVLNIFKTPTDG